MWSLSGYDVFAAVDFETAFVPNSAGMDVAIVDINLPGRSGIELAVAFDGTYVWVATQFNDRLTRVRASDGCHRYYSR
jgi:DNA-binding response OmpR family regulator